MRTVILFLFSLSLFAQTKLDWVTQVKNKPVYDTRMYLTGSDTSGIQEAHDALPSTGGVILVPAGTNISDEVAITKPNVTLKGEGKSSIVQRVSSNSGNFIVVEATATGFTLKDITIDGHSVFNSSAEVWLLGADSMVDNVSFIGARNKGIILEAANLKVTKSTFTGLGAELGSISNYAIYFDSEDADGILVDSNVINSWSKSGLYASGKNVNVVNNLFYGNHCRVGGGQVTFADELWNESLNFSINIVENGCLTAAGLVIFAENVNVFGNTIRNHGTYGVHVLNDGAQIISNIIANSGFSGTPYPGVQIAENISDFRIISNRIYDTMISQSYGVLIEAGTSDNYVISENDLRTNISWAISDGGTGTTKRITNNQGYNPVGPSSITPGASPYTYTAGASPEIIYIRAGTVSGVTRGGSTICTASPCTVTLYPMASLVVTYSSAPTMIKDIQ
jgi:hypothetical protein